MDLLGAHAELAHLKDYKAQASGISSIHDRQQHPISWRDNVLTYLNRTQCMHVLLNVYNR